MTTVGWMDCAEFDLHPTGPLPGRGDGGAAGEAAAVEARMLEPYHRTVAALDNAGVRSGRRSLRVVPAGLNWRFDGNALTLEFSLPGGAYATALLRELVSDDSATISGEV